MTIISSGWQQLAFNMPSIRAEAILPNPRNPKVMCEGEVIRLPAGCKGGGVSAYRRRAPDFRGSRAGSRKGEKVPSGGLRQAASSLWALGADGGVCEPDALRRGPLAAH